jgi:hypothetical protein
LITASTGSDGETISFSPFAAKRAGLLVLIATLALGAVPSAGSGDPLAVTFSVDVMPGWTGQWNG